MPKSRISRGVAWLSGPILTGLLLTVVAQAMRAAHAMQTSTPAHSPPAASAPAVDDVESLFDRLGIDDFHAREQATEELIGLGDAVVARAQKRLTREDDPEIRYRIRFILDNIAPPTQAVLIIRAAPHSGLEPGDLITHVNGRRVRKADWLRQRLSDNEVAGVLRVRGRSGPRDVPAPAASDIICSADYQVPRGPAIVRMIQLFVDGYAEQAYDILKDYPEAIPANELAPEMRAILAWTAGDGTAARNYLGPGSTVQRASQDMNQWMAPSIFDLSGPGKAPFRLERELWARQGPSAAYMDPDMRMQRVFVPANRFVDTFLRAAHLWWKDYRESLEGGDELTTAGNMLAVCGWMLSELELFDECIQLVGPRSQILQNSVNEQVKWLRVQTDAWLPFLAGDRSGAIEALYNDADHILSQPSIQGNNAIIRNPQIAATIAFFLYQMPDDPRVGDMLEVVNQINHPALETYANWMFFSLNEGNQELIQRHAAQMLPNLTGPAAARHARRVALLEYARGTMDRAVLDAARERVSEATDRTERDRASALIDALELLAAGRARDARTAIDRLGDEPGVPTLRATADFIADPPAGAANIPGLAHPLIAVPLDGENRTWIVLRRDHRLVRFDSRSGENTLLDRPNESWYPGPLTWPWLSYEPGHHRVWLYDRRRLLELGRPDGLRMNIHWEQIPAIEQVLAPSFDVLVPLCLPPTDDGEHGEYPAARIQFGAEHVADPTVPELAFVHPVHEDPRLWHVGFRGGASALLVPSTAKSWTSLELASQLGISEPLTFSVQANWPVDPAAPPHAWLMSNHGLIDFDTAVGLPRQIELPSDPHTPAIVPESCPYERHDPRWVYFARLPADGGTVYRLDIHANRVEEVDLINEALPEDYYTAQSRAALRARISALLVSDDLPPLDEFITATIKSVDEWRRRHGQP